MKSFVKAMALGLLGCAVIAGAPGAQAAVSHDVMSISDVVRLQGDREVLVQGTVNNVLGGGRYQLHDLTGDITLHISDAVLGERNINVNDRLSVLGFLENQGGQRAIRVTNIAPEEGRVQVMDGPAPSVTQRVENDARNVEGDVRRDAHNTEADLRNTGQRVETGVRNTEGRVVTAVEDHRPGVVDRVEEKWEETKEKHEVNQEAREEKRALDNQADAQKDAVDQRADAQKEAIDQRVDAQKEAVDQRADAQHERIEENVTPASVNETNVRTTSADVPYVEPTDADRREARTGMNNAGVVAAETGVVTTAAAAQGEARRMENENERPGLMERAGNRWEEVKEKHEINKETREEKRQVEDQADAQKKAIEERADAEKQQLENRTSSIGERKDTIEERADVAKERVEQQAEAQKEALDRQNEAQKKQVEARTDALNEGRQPGNREMVTTTSTAPGAFSTIATAMDPSGTHREGSQVTLRGYIRERLGEDKYVIVDDTGEMKLDIDGNVWSGRALNPDQLVEVRGKLDVDDVDGIKQYKVDVEELRDI